MGFVTACQSPAPPVRPPGQKLHVDVIGDSLIRQTEGRLKTRLGYFGYTFYISSQPSEALNGAFVQGALNDISSNNGDIVVVATASNDALREAALAETQGQVAAQTAYRTVLGSLLTKFSSRCVVVVNGRTDITLAYNPAQVIILNQNIHDEIPSWGNLKVVDWAATSHSMPTSYFAFDGLHFGDNPNEEGTLEGADAYANAVVGGVEKCRQLLQPTP